MKNIDLIICGSGHSIISSHKRAGLPIAAFKVGEESEVDHSNFGLFNVTAPNMNTFYPEATAENVKPEEEDFIYPVFRLLSEVVVNKLSNPVDFRKADVLKNSMGLLKGQTVYTEHEELIGNHVGVVFDTFWQDAYTTNGVKVPAGINGILKLDAKSNPKIARGILQDPPAIHSSSVSVMYAWEKSHDMSNDEFYSKLGTFNEKGELIRKIASDIVLYTELSLVPHGADPFAQLLKDGKVSNPAFAKKFYSLGGDKFSFVDFKNVPKGDIAVEISGFNSTININNKNKKSMETFLEKLAKKINFTGEQTEDTLLSAIDGLLNDNLKNEQAYSKEINDLKAERDNLKTQLDSEKQENLDLKADKDFIQIGKDFLESQTDRAVNLYETVKGDKKDPKMIDIIKNADHTAALSFIKEYEGELDELSPLTCQDCQSTNVVRASASAGDEGDESTTKKPTYKSNLEVIQNRRKSHFSVKRIHGE